MACMTNEEKTNSSRLLVRKPKGKRLLGRRNRRLVDTIKIDFREIEWGGINWTDVVQDRGQEGAHANMVMDLRFP
jgi:hypothetical protein